MAPELLFILWVGVACFGSITIGVVHESQWWERRTKRKQALRKPFGDQRVRILEKQWELEDLKKKTGDPRGTIRDAIDQCKENLKSIDQAVVLMHQAEIDEVQEQRQVADLILSTCQEDLLRFRVSKPSFDKEHVLPRVRVVRETMR